MFEDEAYEKLSPGEAVNKYAEDYIAGYKYDAKTYFPDWHESGEPEDYFSYFKVLDSKVIFDMAGLLSYQISSEDRKGSAKPSTGFRNVVIDLNEGNVLSEQDIFIEDYKKILNPILISKILVQNKAQKPGDLLQYGYWIDDLSSNNNFLIDDKGITYIFNPNEYSTISLGEIQVFIPYGDIKDILKPKSPISVLSGI